MTGCALVAGAVAGGDPLTDAERAHVGGCPDCAALVALPSKLTHVARASEPSPGFAARMTVGAHRRLAARRRRRVLTVALGAVAAALLLFVGAHRLRTDRSLASLPPAASTPLSSEQSARARDLLELARFDRAMAPAAPWSDIEAPLRPYRAILNHHRRHTRGSR